MASGEGVSIALLDSGINPSYPLLSQRKISVFDISPAQGNKLGHQVKKLSEGTNTDRSGHGSVVQSCLALAAPESEVTHYRILDENSQTDSATLCYALDHVLERGHNIVQLSLGTRNEEAIPWLASIMRRAYERNIVIVAAASNIGAGVYPARFTYCVSVEAGDFLDTKQVQFVEKNVVEFRGAGINISIPLPEGKQANVSGSSYAASFVTGHCARILECNPNFTPWDVKVTLREFAMANAKKTHQ